MSEEEIMMILEPMTKDVNCLCENCPFTDENNHNCLQHKMCKEKAIERTFRFI